ncbi:MAG: hypothetical protein A3D92_08035 [Bacteroidetes bacterium RIFCSPHIGHO2_02_FULL_44_7]|nr:MAG: hypothetical protein A3D92_08035 [Bacteroidetes bacterium RIFCSPHIGHO2_02_FULL_44_7]
MVDISSEKDLIARAQRDPQVFGEVFDAYYPAIFGYILRRVGNVQLAEDLTSQVFFKALKKLWQFQWRSLPFSAWLYRIASNEIAYYFRTLHTPTVSLDVLMENEGYEVASEVDVKEELMKAEEDLQRHKDFLVVQKNLAQLPAHYQEVIALRFFEHKKIEEIAMILGKKEGTIKSLLSRGLEKLRLVATVPSSSAL